MSQSAGASAAPPQPKPSGGTTTQTMPTTRYPAPVSPRPAPTKNSLLRQWAYDQFKDTPSRMRLFGVSSAVLAVLFGLVGASNLWNSSNALDRAAANTEQIVRVQSIYADVLRADAAATNSFLVGGNEDPEQRADYETAMQRVARVVAEAARDQPADGAALAALNAELQTYTSRAEQARAYNRQGIPVGAQYQTEASDRLRDQAVPIIQALLQANTTRADDEFALAGSIVPLLAVGLLTLALLVWTGVWLAQRTHRRFNVGLTSGAFLVLVALVVGIAALSSTRDEVNHVRDNQFAGTLALTTARSAAYDAKANESLGLIARGQANVKREPDWQADQAIVLKQLDRIDAEDVQWYGGSGANLNSIKDAWQQYEDQHTQVRTLDDGADWDGAVQLVTDPTTGTRPAFAGFEEASSQAVGGFQDALVSGAAAPGTRSLAISIIVLICGLAAAGLAARGIGQRVKEYR